MKESAFIRALQKCCRNNELIKDSQYSKYYSFDAHFQGCTPLAVINVHDHTELPCILKACIQHGMAVIPRGNGSGQTGGSVPIRQKSIILNFSPMKKIVSFNLLNRSIVVEPGIIIQELNDYLHPHNLFFST